MLGFQIVVQIRQILQFIDTGNIRFVQCICVNRKAIVQPIHQQFFRILLQIQCSSFPAGREIVQSTSLPQTWEITN